MPWASTGYFRYFYCPHDVRDHDGGGTIVVGETTCTLDDHGKLKIATTLQKSGLIGSMSMSMRMGRGTSFMVVRTLSHCAILLVNVTHIPDRKCGNTNKRRYEAGDAPRLTAMPINTKDRGNSWHTGRVEFGNIDTQL
jgi:hypothetical protein